MEPTLGLHEPLVSRETFDHVQAFLAGKKLPKSPKLKSDPDFPLSACATSESFVRFAELQLTGMAHVWRFANHDQRERVENLLFDDGLKYSPKTGFSNRAESSF